MIKKQTEKQTEKEIEDKIKKLTEKLERIRSSKLWKCPFCNKSKSISKLDLIVPYYFHHGHNGGGYRPNGDYIVFCGYCETACRYFSYASQWNKYGTYSKGLEFILENQYAFGNTIDYKEASLDKRATISYEDSKQFELKSEEVVKFLIDKLEHQVNVPHYTAKEVKKMALLKELAELECQE